MQFLICFLMTSSVRLGLISQQSVPNNDGESNVNDKKILEDLLVNVSYPADLSVDMDGLIIQLEERCDNIVNFCEFMILLIEKSKTPFHIMYVNMIRPSCIFFRHKNRELARFYTQSIHSIYITTANIWNLLYKEYSDNCQSWSKKDRRNAFFDSLKTWSDIHLLSALCIHLPNILFIIRRNSIKMWQKFFPVAKGWGELLHEISNRVLNAYQNNETCPVDQKSEVKLQAIMEQLKRLFVIFNELWSEHPVLIDRSIAKYDNLLHKGQGLDAMKLVMGNNNDQVRDVDLNEYRSYGTTRKFDGKHKTTIPATPEFSHTSTIADASSDSEPGISGL